MWVALRVYSNNQSMELSFKSIESLRQAKCQHGWRPALVTAPVTPSLNTQTPAVPLGPYLQLSLWSSPVYMYSCLKCTSMEICLGKLQLFRKSKPGGRKK